VFALKLVMPASVAARDESDATLSDAVQTVFPLEERAFLEWNGLTMPLSYKYDISLMLEDIVEMVLVVGKTESGVFQVDWPSSGFPFRWTLRWDASEVEVHAQARHEPGAVDLTGHERLRVERGSFVGAWQALLGTVLSCREGAGYDSLQINGLSRLRMAARPAAERR
jgi:hypothetical protein